MRRGAAVRIAVAVAALSAVAVSAAAERSPKPRLHRLQLPPAPVAAAPGQPPPPPVGLPTSFAVNEFEFRLTVSRMVVAAGDVTINVYNRGEDDHDLAVTDADGTVQRIDIPPRDSRSMSVRLAPGRVKVWCSLPTHEDLGMRAFLDVV